MSDYMKFYDRQGVEISMERYAQLHIDFDYKVLKQDDVLTPDGDMYWVSTVWLGMNHNYFDKGPPLIFETMVFEDGMSDVYCDRYPTERSAREGHALVVASLISGLDIGLYGRSEKD